jgi:hypothetical protein
MQEIPDSTAEGENVESYIPEQEEDESKDEMRILRKITTMMEYAYPALEQFPRTQRYSLAGDIRESMTRMVKIAIAADKKIFKKTSLTDLDIELATLKKYVRISKDLKYLPFKKYRIWMEQLLEIGNMIGKWIQSQYGDYPQGKNGKKDVHPPGKNGKKEEQPKDKNIHKE